MKIIVMLIALALSMPVFAEDETTKDPAAKMDTKTMVERHKKMAKAHEKAADCLEDGKDVAECHAQLKETMEKAPCPVDCPMHKKGMGKGRRSK